MPEGLEAEIWRRAVAPLAGRIIDRVWFDDRVAPPDLGDALTGRTIEGARRRGKIVLIDTDGPTLGFHLGMTGRIEVDGAAEISRLAYASGADRPDWDRLRLFTANRSGPIATPALRMNDPRRLGKLTLDPDVSGLGVDVFALSADDLTLSLSGRRAAIKTLLLEQSVVAGLGNLCADEVLFDAGVAPTRSAADLSAADVESIVRSCHRRLPAMLAAGGSTHGVLDPQVRSDLPPCPVDGGQLRRATVGGRTAVWCATHQR